MKEANQYSYCNVVGDTDVGCKRKANEDWYVHFECKNGLVSVVCDGMGGHVGGAVASHLATETIQQFLEKNFFEDPRTAIIEACNAANSAILQRTSVQPELTGMGSTCVMLIVRDGKVYMGSIGDSRIYLIRSKRIRQLTKDQSFVQMLVDEGTITKEQAEHHPRKNEITNALGLPSMQPATVLPDPFNPEAGDCFLLCSDGLSGMVSDHDILKVASDQTHLTQRERVNELIQRARKNGGSDNITCMIVEFAITPESSSDQSHLNKRTLLRYVLPCLVGAVLLGIGIYKLIEHRRPAKAPSTTEFYSDQPKTTIISTIDTVDFVNGKLFVEIEGIEHLGIRIYVHDYKGSVDTLAILGEHVKFNKILPESTFDITEASGRTSFKFKGSNSDFEYSDISLEFHDTEKDSTIVYAFPVLAPKVKQNEKTDSQQESEKAAKSIFSRSVSCDATVSLKGKKGASYNFFLLADNGKNNNDTVYTDNIAIKAESKSESWYSYQSKDSYLCEITVKLDHIPQEESKALIKIPLKNSDDKEFFVILVKRN